MNAHKHGTVPQLSEASLQISLNAATVGSAASCARLERACWWGSRGAVSPCARLQSCWAEPYSVQTTLKHPEPSSATMGGQRHSKNAGTMGSESQTYHERTALGYGTVRERLGKVQGMAVGPSAL